MSPASACASVLWLSCVRKGWRTSDVWQHLLQFCSLFRIGRLSTPRTSEKSDHLPYQKSSSGRKYLRVTQGFSKMSSSHSPGLPFLGSCLCFRNIPLKCPERSFQITLSKQKSVWMGCVVLANPGLLLLRAHNRNNILKDIGGVVNGTQDEWVSPFSGKCVPVFAAEMLSHTSLWRTHF